VTSQRAATFTGDARCGRSPSRLRRADPLLAAGRLLRTRREIIVYDLAKPQGQIGQDVHGGKDFQDRQFGDRRHGMRAERQGAWTGPRAFDRDVLEVILDQLANARATVDVRNDLQKKVWRRQRRLGGRRIDLLVLITHRSCRHPDGSVVKRADQHIDLGTQAGTGKLLWKTPKLTPAGDRRLVVEEHAMAIATLFAVECDRNDLGSFGVVAEAG